MCPLVTKSIYSRFRKIFLFICPLVFPGYFVTTLIALWVQLNIGINLSWFLTAQLIFRPFFLGGLILALSFDLLPFSPSVLYGIDLLFACMGGCRIFMFVTFCRRSSSVSDNYFISHYRMVLKFVHSCNIAVINYTLYHHFIHTNIDE